MKILIRNMVCDRCKMVVGNVLKTAGLHPNTISLGAVELDENLSEIQLKSLDEQLKNFGFEIISDKNKQLIEQVKNKIVELIHHSDQTLKTNLSEYLTNLIHHDYTYLSNLFSQIEGTTIEKYYILQRVEKIKELLGYNELNLDEIAFKLGYSSSAYLSNQFKKITGFTPSQFRKLPDNKRVNIEEL